MPAPLTLLHTAASHVAGFDRLLADMAPNAGAKHAVQTGLLALARRHGTQHETVTAAVAGAVREASGEAGDGVVLCTCSTIGDSAERAGREHGLNVLRVDRPMAEHAVRIGPRVLVLAALESTLAPTANLLREAAGAAGSTIDLRTHLCEHAWSLFEAGRQQDYLQAIAEEVAHVAAQADVVVLAQASMASAAALCRDTPPVLSSPRSGLAAALALAGHPTSLHD